MYAEDDLIMISALQHFAFCERQCALIHLEQVWEENRLTAEGKILHERVDQATSESRKDVRIATSVRIRSLRIGITGVIDLLEFHRLESPVDANGIAVGVALPRASGFWRPFPVEYKRGKPKENRADEVQLCAQALALEEMLGVAIQAGALFYGQTRRRLDVPFDEDLRGLTERMAEGVHALLDGGRTPPAVYSPKCKSCSLLEICRPRLQERRSAKKWIERALAED
jgi:CRISPR-associated exonuclease Cas4